MLLYGILLVPMVLGALDESTVNVSVVDKFILKVENKILKNIETTDDISFDLDLSGLDIHGVDANAFENVSHIKNLSLANNRISTLPQSVFASLKDLKHLSLADNRIGNWHLHPIFQGLNNLTSLNISSNPMAFLSQGYFEGLGKFTDIITVGNAFRNMNTRAFERYDKPQIMERRRRHLETPEVSLLKSNESLKFLFPVSILEVKVCIREGVLEELEAFTNISQLESHCKKISIDYSSQAVTLNGLGISKFSAGWYHLQNYRVISLHLNRNNIVNVSREMLNDLPKELRYVDLSHNKIETLTKGTIINEYLFELDFTGNAIAEIEESVFKNTKLRSLILSSNRLRNTTFVATLPPTLVKLKLDENHIVLSSNFCFGLTTLKTLDLSGNNIRNIEKGSFQNLESLLELNLDRNNLTSLDKGTFDGLGNLKYIDLSSNNLTKITRDSLQGLSDIFDLHLSFNQIETLEAGTFVDQPKQRIILDNNRIKKIENGTFNMRWLYELNLKNNFLNRLDDESFHGIRKLFILDLANNGITKITKSNLQNLSPYGYLKISKNPIKRLENGAFSGLSNVGRTIELTDVPIELIQGGVFDDL